MYELFLGNVCSVLKTLENISQNVPKQLRKSVISYTVRVSSTTQRKCVKRNSAYHNIDHVTSVNWENQIQLDDIFFFFNFFAVLHNLSWE